jgi:molybdopterin-binding protein
MEEVSLSAERTAIVNSSAKFLRMQLYFDVVREKRSMAKSEQLLTPREAAAAVGVSYATIKKWILAGSLKTVLTPGGHHRIPESALSPLVGEPAESKRAKARVHSRERFRTVSGRNQLVGTIVEVKIRGILAQVKLAIGDQSITSIITADAAREMQLRKGQTAAALMKATSVMITRV